MRNERMKLLLLQAAHQQRNDKVRFISADVFAGAPTLSNVRENGFITIFPKY